MREHDRTMARLALVLGIGLTSVGCSDDQGRHGLSTTTHDWTAGDDQQGSETAAEPETSTGDAEVSEGSSDGSTSAAPGGSTGDGGESSDEASDSSGGAVDPLCEAYEGNFIECFPDNVEDAPGEYDYCLYAIQTGVDHSPACAAAYEALFACLAAVDCETWPISTATDVACPEEDNALYTDCAS